MKERFRHAVRGRGARRGRRGRGRVLGRREHDEDEPPARATAGSPTPRRYGIVDQGPDGASGSTDMANVSWAVPGDPPGPLDHATARPPATRSSSATRPPVRAPTRRRCSPRRSSPRPRSTCSSTRRSSRPRGGVPGERRAERLSRPRRRRRDVTGPELRCRRRAPLDGGSRTGGARTRRHAGAGPHASNPDRRLRRTTVADRPQPPGDVDFAARNGWDQPYETYDDFDLPTYVGLPTFMKLPWVPDPAELAARKADVAIVGAPFDDAVSHRPGARFGPRAIREAQYTIGLDPLAPAGHRAVRGAHRRRRRRRQHRPVLDRPRPRAHLPQGPRGGGDRRDPDRARRRPLDHLAVGDRRRRGARGRAASGSSTSTPTPTPRTTTGACSPATARRCAG